MSKNSPDQKIRLDKWLWAARFFKTRAMATEAISGGHVHMNGERVKPSRLVNVEDTLRIRKGPQELVVVVKGVSDKRGPASAAQALYEETPASIEAREQRALERKLHAASAPVSEGRPNKRNRRHIIRFTRSQ